MTVERKEPTLSGMAPPRDEPKAARSHAAQPTAPQSSAPQQGAPAAGSSKPRKAPTPVSARQVKSSPWGGLALILALLGLGAGGFSYWQLTIAKQDMVAAEVRIADLEKRLVMSDDESSQSVSVLQANVVQAKDELKVAQNEIRKLWDTRNVNKKAISDNAKQISAAAKSAKTAASTAAAAQKLAQVLDGRWKTLSNDVAMQTEQLGVVADLSEGQQKRVRELVDKASRLDSELARVKNDLGGRLKTNEDAIEAIDAYRLSVNRDIQDLKRRFGTPTSQ